MFLLNYICNSFFFFNSDFFGSIFCKKEYFLSPLVCGYILLCIDVCIY